MPQTDHDQIVGPDGSIISETIVERPAKTVSDQQFKTAKQIANGFLNQYFPSGVPTGQLTITDARDWLIAVTVIAKYNAQEMDDDV